MIEMVQNRDNGPLVSVVMPAFNAEQFIAEAISSVRAQTVEGWELIVIDDCSTDKTREIVNAFTEMDPRIHLICNDVNCGVAKTRNHGMDMCRGQYIALLDSDDIWYQEKLEEQLRCIDQTGAELCYTSYRLVNADDKTTINEYLVPETITFQEMLSQNRIGCSTVMMVRDLANRYRFGDKYYHEDYVLWLQMLRQGVRFVGNTKVLVDYRYYPSSKAGNKLASAKHRWSIYRDYLGMPLHKCVAAMARYGYFGLLKYKRI